MGYSPWGRKDSDTTERLHLLVCICQSQTPKLSLLPNFPFGIHKFVFYVCKSVSELQLEKKLSARYLH